MGRFLLKICIVIGILILPGVTHADDSNREQDEIDISIEPDNVLFNIDNMKPGDWAPRTINVKNTGKKDFSYQMSIENKGDKKLFNELVLEISDSQVELYKGKLSDFRNLPTRRLSVDSQEELMITVRMPEQLGNEFQGTVSEFSFIFTAEGEDRAEVEDKESIDSVLGSTPNGGAKLPDTATNLFNLILIGSILVISGLVILGINYYKKHRPRKI